MKVGDYVRTNEGKIDKIINLDYYIPRYIECENGIISKEYIIKSSPNIIDLIEVGDYVNGERVFLVDNKVYTVEGNDYTESEIKSIVTKEQFERMEYKLGE